MRFVGIILLLGLCVFCPPIWGYENAVYIWHGNWHPEILESIARIKPLSSHFMVLAGELKREDQQFSFFKVPVNWAYLKNAETVTLDIRMRRTFAKPLQDKNNAPLIDYFKQSVINIIRDAKRVGINVQGIQIDYDCPTANLPDYIWYVR